eukprot:39391-Pleurochrysis_carterae.AAC.1
MRGGKKLARLRQVFEELLPELQHEIPRDAEMRISMLGGGGAITSENCNAALNKVKNLLKRAVQDAVHAGAEARGDWDTLSDAAKEARQLVLE